jgi:hypothetical protein
VLGGLIGSILLMGALQPQAGNSFHGEDLAFYRLAENLPQGYNGLFAGSGKCASCHGIDPEGIASTALDGSDVNVLDDWRSTMMGNAARDPYWRAKVLQEVAVNPDMQEEIESTCTKCHAPLGAQAAIHMGGDPYTFAHLAEDSLGRDGVSCLACHQQSTESLGDTHSGELHFESDPVAFGQFESPLISPMALESGYNPEYSTHIQDAGICAGCHTLITQTVTPLGEVTESTFVEQATYHEWLNSDYGEDAENITCQQCHMPSLGTKQQIYLAAGYETEPRAPFSLHTLVGGNVRMLEVLRNNIAALELTADAEQFDATIDATLDMLQNQTLEGELNFVNRTLDTLYLEVMLENLAGHKLPSGYPSRRMWVELEVTDPLDNTVYFHSGAWDDFGIVGEDADWEPHYTEINQSEQVQIYECIMADTDGNRTTILEQGAELLKDNRMVPRGFSISHQVYDTTQVIGAALLDSDFNYEDGLEGSGTDRIKFNVGTDGFAGDLDVHLRVWYQSIPPRWINDLLENDEVEEIAAVGEMLLADHEYEAVLLHEESLLTGIYVSTDELLVQSVEIKHITGASAAWVQTDRPLGYEVYTANGKLVMDGQFLVGNNPVEFGVSPGIYILSIQDRQGRRLVKRVLIGQ